MMDDLHVFRNMVTDTLSHLSEQAKANASLSTQPKEKIATSAFLAGINLSVKVISEIYLELHAQQMAAHLISEKEVDLGGTSEKHKY